MPALAAPFLQLESTVKNVRNTARRSTNTFRHRISAESVSDSANRIAAVFSGIPAADFKHRISNSRKISGCSRVRPDVIGFVSLRGHYQNSPKPIMPHRRAITAPATTSLMKWTPPTTRTMASKVPAALMAIPAHG